MDQEILIELILKLADKYGTDPAIIYGVCQQESGFNELAVRHEPNYKWTWKPKEAKPRWCSVDTERMLQKTSIGLMQVMGAVYREFGFKGWLTSIVTDPEIQLEYGCLYLSKKIVKYGRDGGIVAYNSGSPRYTTDGKYRNAHYLENVLKYATRAVTTGLLPEYK